MFAGKSAQVCVIGIYQQRQPVTSQGGCPGSEKEALAPDFGLWGKGDPEKIEMQGSGGKRTHLKMIRTMGRRYKKWGKGYPHKYVPNRGKRKKEKKQRKRSEAGKNIHRQRFPPHGKNIHRQRFP